MYSRAKLQKAVESKQPDLFNEAAEAPAAPMTLADIPAHAPSSGATLEAWSEVEGRFIPVDVWMAKYSLEVDQEATQK